MVSIIDLLFSYCFSHIFSSLTLRILYALMSILYAIVVFILFSLVRILGGDACAVETVGWSCVSGLGLWAVRRSLRNVGLCFVCILLFYLLLLILIILIFSYLFFHFRKQAIATEQVSKNLCHGHNHNKSLVNRKQKQHVKTIFSFDYKHFTFTCLLVFNG